MTTQLSTLLVATTALGGVVAAAFLAGIASDKRGVIVVFATSSPLALAIGLSHPLMQVSTTWIAASVALNAALALAHDAVERQLRWAVGPLLLLAGLASYFTLSSLQPPLAHVAVVAIPLAGVWAGWRLHHLRRRQWFGDVSMLALLTSIALMAAPTLLLGWRRAGIAAEGQDAVTLIASPLWPLVVSAIAFVFGLSWRVWMSMRDKR